MTNGERSGTSGIFWRSLPLFAGAILTLNVINVLSGFTEAPEVPRVYFVVYEATSFVCSLAFLWICWIAYTLAPIGQAPIWRIAVVHSLGLLIFGACHIGGFLVLRVLIFRHLGLEYEADFPGRFVYELRKDGFGYVLGTAGFWAMTRIYGQKSVETTPAPAATFDIRDGAKLTRAPVADILAVSSAGNYVEFVLADGRKLLMRSSLAAIEAQLAPLGFVRTHRSWLVNAARVTELRPEKSGDYAVQAGDLEVPLSRRFPEALARLRG